MKIIEIAQEIYTSSLNSPSDVGVGSIAFFLRESAVGQFNNLLGEDLTIGTDAQLSRNLTEGEKSIFKLLYLVHFYDGKIRNSLGASGTDSTIEVSDFGTTIRKVSKVQVAQTWMQLRKEAKKQLDEQISAIIHNAVRPIQCAGDDTSYSLNGGLS